jgi:hypothetical protein
MIARVEKSFYGAQALLELVSDTEPFSDSSSASSAHDHSSVTNNGANHPTPRGLSRAPTRATDADRSRSDTDSEPVRRQGVKTKKRRRDSSTNSDLTNKSVTAGSKRRKAYRNKLYRKVIEQESADERAAAENKKKTKKQAIREQEDLQKRDP